MILLEMHKENIIILVYPYIFIREIYRYIKILCAKFKMLISLICFLPVPKYSIETFFMVR